MALLTSPRPSARSRSGDRDSLISDKLGEGDWRSHKGKANSTLVNTATWGLVIGRALTSDSENASALRKLISRTGEPFVRTGVGAAMRMMGEIFVMGRNIDEAIERMGKRENKGFTASFDMLGEAARTFLDADRYTPPTKTRSARSGGFRRKAIRSRSSFRRSTRATRFRNMTAASRP